MFSPDMLDLTIRVARPSVLQLKELICRCDAWPGGTSSTPACCKFASCQRQIFEGRNCATSSDSFLF